MKTAICDNTDRPGYSAKWNKSHREKQIPYDLTYMWNLKKKKKTPELKDTKKRFVVARGAGASKIGEWGQKV